MRLAILNSGRGLCTKALFAIIRMASRQPVRALACYVGDDRQVDSRAHGEC